MKTGEGEANEDKRRQKERETDSGRNAEIHKWRIRERVREICGETLTVGEGKIKVFDRGGKKRIFFICVRAPLSE